MYLEDKFNRLLKKGMVYCKNLKSYRQLEEYAWSQGYEVKPQKILDGRSIMAVLVVHE